MKSFKEYITEVTKQNMIVPAMTRIAEPLPHGFSIKGNPSGEKKKPKSEKKPIKSKPLTFAERLKRAKELAAKNENI